MPEIVATASKVDIAPHVRDGYIMMFNYLPITFGDKFTPYVGPIIPCILKVGTSDSAEEEGSGEGAAALLSSLAARWQESSPCSFMSPLPWSVCPEEAALLITLCLCRLWLMRMSLFVTPPYVQASGSSLCTLRQPLPCCCPSWSKASLMTSGEFGEKWDQRTQWPRL